VMRVVRPTFHPSGKSPQWILSNGGTCRSDYIVVIRTDSIDYEPIDYYLLPSVALPPKCVRLGGRTWRRLERYRYGDRADLVYRIRQLAFDCVETSSGLLTDALEPTGS
jgi:hypothetical protein